MSCPYLERAIVEHQLVIHTSIDKSGVVVFNCRAGLIQLICIHKDRVLNTVGLLAMSDNIATLREFRLG